MIALKFTKNRAQGFTLSLEGGWDFNRLSVKKFIKI